jgi:hypothetical protein
MRSGSIKKEEGFTRETTDEVEKIVTETLGSVAQIDQFQQREPE